MTQVHIDPEQLRNFAGELKKFNKVVNSYFQAMPGEMNRLGNTWRDQEYEKFKRGFGPALQKLSVFTQETEKVIPQIERDASAIEDYQKRGR
jgi:uncharacterized protein YukE